MAGNVGGEALVSMGKVAFASFIGTAIEFYEDKLPVEGDEAGKIS